MGNLMTLQEFLVKYRANSRDTRVVTKIYGGQEKSESAWLKELKGKITLHIPTKKKAATEEAKSPFQGGEEESYTEAGKKEKPKQEPKPKTATARKRSKPSTKKNETKKK